MAIYYLVSSIYKYIYCICRFAPRQKTLNLFSGMLKLNYSKRFFVEKLTFSVRSTNFPPAGRFCWCWRSWTIWVLVSWSCPPRRGQGVWWEISKSSLFNYQKGQSSGLWLVCFTEIVGQISNFVCVGGGRTFKEKLAILGQKKIENQEYFNSDFIFYCIS